MRGEDGLPFLCWESLQRPTAGVRGVPSLAVRKPSQSQPAQRLSPTQSGQSFPVYAIVAITIGAALLFFATTCLVFAYHRRATRRKKTSRMHQTSQGYQAVSATAPFSPVRACSSLSSLSTQALFDLGFFGEEAHGNTLRAQPPQRPIRNRATDRQSIDTIFALRFYYSHDLDRRSKGSLLADLPRTQTSPSEESPLSLPIQQPPSSAATTTEAGPSTQAPKGIPTRRRKPSMASKNRKRKGRIYLNPAGEPWVRVPPPTTPLPPTPEGLVASAPSTVPVPPIPTLPEQRTARSSSIPREPRLSLFPPPPKPPPGLTTKIQRDQSQSKGQRQDLWQLSPQRESKGGNSAQQRTPAALMGTTSALSSDPTATTTTTTETRAPLIRASVSFPRAGLRLAIPIDNLETQMHMQTPQVAPAAAMSPGEAAGKAERRSLPGWLWGRCSVLGGWRSPKLRT